MPTNVLLLRAPSEGPTDSYELAFKNLGFNSANVPVLETAFANVDDLKETIYDNPKSNHYVGVVITSARSCEAWANALDTAVPELINRAADWSAMPFYVVGEATKKALSSIGETRGPGRLIPTNIRGGSQTGTSEHLAHFILNDLSERKESSTLLYLTGDKNRDTLHKILSEGGIEVEPLKVYETRGSSTFAEDLERTIKQMPAEVSRWWIVFFAPSAAEFVTPILRHSFNLPSVEESHEGTSNARMVELAAIGPTTRAFIVDALRLRVAVTSPKPNAEILADAIKRHDSANAVTL